MQSIVQDVIVRTPEVIERGRSLVSPGFPVQIADAILNGIKTAALQLQTELPAGNEGRPPVLFDRLIAKVWNGGADRNRTCDLLIANETLCQLSYDPIQSCRHCRVTSSALPCSDRRDASAARAVIMVSSSPRASGKTSTGTKLCLLRLSAGDRSLAGRARLAPAAPSLADPRRPLPPTWGGTGSPVANRLFRS